MARRIKIINNGKTYYVIVPDYEDSHTTLNTGIGTLGVSLGGGSGLSSEVYYITSDVDDFILSDFDENITL